MAGATGFVPLFHKKKPAVSTVQKVIDHYRSLSIFQIVPFSGYSDLRGGRHVQQVVRCCSDDHQPRDLPFGYPVYLLFLWGSMLDGAKLASTNDRALHSGPSLIRLRQSMRNFSGHIAPSVTIQGVPYLPVPTQHPHFSLSPTLW